MPLALKPSEDVSVNMLREGEQFLLVDFSNCGEEYLFETAQELQTHLDNNFESDGYGEVAGIDDARIFIIRRQLEIETQTQVLFTLS